MNIVDLVSYVLIVAAVAILVWAIMVYRKGNRNNARLVHKSFQVAYRLLDVTTSTALERSKDIDLLLADSSIDEHAKLNQIGEYEDLLNAEIALDEICVIMGAYRDKYGKYDEQLAEDVDSMYEALRDKESVLNRTMSSIGDLERKCPI